MIKRLKQGYFQLLILFVLMTTLMSLLWLTDSVFAPFNNWVFALVLLVPVVGFTVNAVRQRKNKTSYLPLLLPPLSVGIMFLMLFTVEMNFEPLLAFPIDFFLYMLSDALGMLFFVMAVCSMIVFFVSTKRLKWGWTNIAIKTAYSLVAVLVGLVVFFGTLLLSLAGFQTEGEPKISPSREYVAEFGTYSSVIDTHWGVRIRRNGGANLGIGRVRLRGQLVQGYDMRGSRVEHTEWLDDEVFEVVTFRDMRNQTRIRQRDGEWQISSRP